MEEKKIYARASDKMRDKLPLLGGRRFEKRDALEVCGVNGSASHKDYRDAVGQVLYNWSHQLKEPVLEQDGKYYRVIKKEFKTIKPGQFENPRFDLSFPQGRDDTRFQFADSVVITRGDVIGLGGEGNRGKSAVAINMAVENMDKHKVTLVLSENEQRLDPRLTSIDWVDIYTDATKADWKFEVIPANGQGEFLDIARERNGNLIIYDWLNVTTDAYRVPEFYDALGDRNSNGVSFVVQQKRTYKDYAVGGEGALDYCSLFLILQTSRIEVVKAKVYDEFNPNGLIYRFDLVGGGNKFMDIHEIEKCHSCHGAKYVKKELCYTCQGTGYTDVINDF